MEINILCYGTVLKITGSERVEITVKPEATVSDALNRLVEEYSGLEEIIHDQESLVIMRDGNHLECSTRLAENDLLSISTPPMRD